MELIIDEDAEGRPGYAWLEVADADETEEAVFSRAARDNPWLGPEGRWQSVPHVFSLTRGKARSGHTALRLTPEIVDVIPGDTRMSVELPRRKQTLTGWWPHLEPSGRARGPGVVVVGGAIRKRPLAAAEPEKAVPLEEPEKPIERPAPPPPRKRRSLLLPLFLLLLLLAGGGAAAWYFDLLPPEILRMLGLPERNTAREPGSDVERSVEELREKLNRMIAEGASAQDLYDFGRPLYELADVDRRAIGYAAIDAAAQRGHPEALYELGRIFDPRDPVPGQRVGVEKPDPQLAARYYKAAAEKGAADAGGALGGLCEWLRRAPPEPDSPAGKALSESCS